LTPGQCQIVTPKPLYTVTQDDVCDGWLNNTAIANGTDSCDEPVETDEAADSSIPADYTASINITKEANLSSAQLGDVIEYTYTVENTGNVNLSSIAVEDNRLGTINETE